MAGCLCALGCLACFEVHAATRSREGLQALYDFRAPIGATVEDSSGVGEPLNLRISNPDSVRRSAGSLEVVDKTLIRSEKPAAKIIDAVRRSGEITIEAWIRPANNSQDGPARIVTLSKDTGERNVTLGQAKDQFDVRLRTTKTSGNGIPSLTTPGKSVVIELVHVTYTRARDGRARIYLNGKPRKEEQVPGGPTNWDRSFHLALANEMTGDRPWRGTYHLVALYSRSLSSAEVEQNYRAGVVSRSEPKLVVKAPPKPLPEKKGASPDASAAAHFDAAIAPLLARHCLECHGPKKQKGRLDLSNRDAAFAGGKSGKVIIPGKAKESLLWQNVQSNEMPDERPPLSADEKRLLRDWIEAGAVWSANASAPLAHVAGRDSRTWLRRLTVPEYIETVQSAVGVAIETDARRILPPDLRADGFNNTAYNLSVDLGHVEAYARLARMIVTRMDTKAFTAQFTKCRELSPPCMRELIARMGKWLLRGPLEAHEIDAFARISSAVAKEGGDFNTAAGYIIEAMLQSPRFLYRIENQHDDGKPRRLSDYEVASRLSYILWGAPPDRELMRAADAGELAAEQRVRSQVERMLQDPRAVERSCRFVYEWLNLDRLNHLRPSPKKFPEWDKRLAGDMRDETVAFFKDIVWEQKRPLSDLLNAEVTYVTPQLARHYGLKWDSAVAASAGREWKAGAFKRTPGLQALYVFEKEEDDVIRDVSGAGEPIQLKIREASAVQQTDGRLNVRGSTLITTVKTPTRLINAVQKANAITIEAWLTPANTSQKGPARIVTLSDGTGQRNFTLGQDGNRFDVRLRTSATDANGLPSLSSASGAVETRLTHVAYTRDASGATRLYVNGEARGVGDAGGDFSNWNDGFQLGLANETSRDRPWQGTFHMVAIYDRALTAEEISSHGGGLSRYDLSRVSGRGGLLTQGSVLTVGGEDASMVARGLFVLRDLLYGEVGDPPPCVDTTPVPTKPGLTQRAISEQRLANASCAGCHKKFEPFAFGLEKYDGLGAYREKDEHGNSLREDGKILFPDTEKPIPYQSSAELMNLLASSERVRQGITRKVAQFALGRPLVPADESVLEQIHQTAQRNGATYASLITAIVMSDLVQKTQTETKR